MLDGTSVGKTFRPKSSWALTTSLFPFVARVIEKLSDARIGSNRIEQVIRSKQRIAWHTLARGALQPKQRVLRIVHLRIGSSDEVHRMMKVRASPVAGDRFLNGLSRLTIPPALCEHDRRGAGDIGLVLRGQSMQRAERGVRFTGAFQSDGILKIA